jgi:hypothetical protein
MPMPPEDVSASELFIKLTQEVRPSEVVDFPRRTASGKPVGELRICVLNMEEHDRARLNAEQWAMAEKHIARENLDNPASREVIGDRVAREVLAMACVSVDPIDGSEHTPSGVKYNVIFHRPEQLDKLRPDELNTLFTMYKMVQRKWGPYEGNLENEAQVTAWERRLVEGASAVPLGRLDWHQLVELTTCLAERSYTLSAILDSQRERLPPTLGARLSGWGIGTTSRGVLPASATSIGLTSADLGSEVDVDGEPAAPFDESLMNVLPSGPIDLREATEMAKKLNGG